MEKLLYPLWKPESLAVDAFRDQLLQVLGPQLLDLQGVHGARLAVADSAVAAASGRRIESNRPLPEAMLSLWVDFAGAAHLWEPLLDASTGSKAGYLVTEAEPLVSQHAHPSGEGERVYGMCHVVFMEQPARLSRAEWLAIWKDSHTGVAIDTQSTFGYRQNLVARLLTPESRDCQAIVEEHFPPEAMADDHAFYATGGDEQLLQQRMTAMIESCARFIDFDRLDVVPMSEYIIGHRR